jgi:hypothetical protein
MKALGDFYFDKTLKLMASLLIGEISYQGQM